MTDEEVGQRAMLRGRQGFWPFVLAWVGIALLLAIMIAGVFWFGGSFKH